MEGLQDYLSCKIKFLKDKKRAWLGQPHLIKNMEKKFGEHIQDILSHKTPGMPKFLISAKHQQEYQLGVGILLYLVKHLHPDLANTTRELSKVNGGTNPAAYKELLHVIKYVLDMKTLDSKLNPQEFQQTLGD